MADIRIRTCNNEIINLIDVEKIYKKEIIDERTGRKYFEALAKHISGKDILIETYDNEEDIKKAMDKFLELYYHKN